MALRLESENLNKQEIIAHPTIKQPGFDLPRKIWVLLNHLQIDHGRYNHLMYKWKLQATPACDCSYESQIISHIVID